ncbi:MAG: hypothetical protein QOD94_3178 [Alphaproteobacteria bacterium]|nr:hypothetical protein [Alphaproteobacteria bacterium]
MPLLRMIAAVVALTAALPVGDARADDPYYKGKRLSVLINFAPGSSADIEGRLFAKHLVKHIEGQPQLLMQNIEGAGGITGAQYLGEIAPKDGTAIGYFTGQPWIYVTDPSRWRVDLKSFEFVATHGGTTVHFVRKDVKPGIKTPADILKAQDLVAGGITIDTAKDVRMRLVLDMLGVPYKYVTGYRSSAQARLAVQRNELDVFSESPPSYRTMVEPQLVKTGLALPFAYDDLVDPPSLYKQLEGISVPSFPQLYKQVKGTMPSGPLWDIYSINLGLGALMLRVVALPPGAPKQAMDALRSAIEKLNDDKEFAAEALKTLEIVPDYVTAPDLSEKVRARVNITDEQRKLMNDYMRNVPKR